MICSLLGTKPLTKPMLTQLDLDPKERFSEISIEIPIFSLEKKLKTSSATYRLFSLGLYVLTESIIN